MKTILFDFDGTIADSGKTILECANILSEKYNYPKLSDWDLLRNKPTKEIFSDLLGLKWYRIPFYVNDGRRLFQLRYADVELFDELRELLIALSDHFRLVVASSNAPESVKSILNRNGAQYFDQIVGNIGIGGKKKVINRLLKEYKLNKNEVIYIGDEVRDLEASSKAGIEFVGVTWGLHSKEFLVQQGAKRTVDTPAELLELLLEWEAK